MERKIMEISETRYNGLIEQHRRMERERDAALSRAEAAERRVAELEARLAEMDRVQESISTVEFWVDADDKWHRTEFPPPPAAATE